MHGRNLRAALVVVGALAVPAGASAATSQFISSRHGNPEPLAGRGSSGTEGAQTLDLPPFTVSCSVARSTGGPGPGYTQLRDDVKFSRCTTSVDAEGQNVTIPARVKGAMDLFHKGNGNAELVNPFEVLVPALKCTIAIAEGSELHNIYAEPTGGGGGEGKAGANPFENIAVPTRNLNGFPSGVKHEIVVHNRLIGVSYSFSSGCSNLSPGVGTYSGATVEEAVGGDLEFVPGSEWSRVENAEEG